MQKKIAVVILNYNGKNWLEKFLPSVLEHSSELSDVIVADNLSTDDSIQFLNAHYPDLNIIRIKENKGYAGGYNAALKEIDYPYFVLLNSDIEVSANWLKPQLELLENNPEIAACQPKIRSYNDKEYFEYAGAAGGYIDYLGYPFCKGRIFSNLEKDTNQYETSADIFWASGAALFIRSEVYWEAGGLDERYFAHMEEIDLCWRIKNLGYRILYCPGATVFHVGGGTLDSENPRKAYLNFRNSLATLAKNLPRNKKVRIIFTRLVLDGVASVQFIKEGKFKHVLAIIKAHFSFYKMLPYLIKNSAKAKNYPDQVYKGSMVKEFFIHKKDTFDQLNSKKWF